MPSVITSRAIVRRASKLLLASPLQTISRSVTIPISRSSSPIGMQPMSCPCINFASSVTGVSGLTQSIPLCITSLTFMADLRYWITGALDATQHSPPFLNHTTDRMRRHLKAQKKSIIPTRSDQTNARRCRIRQRLRGAGSRPTSDTGGLSPKSVCPAADTTDKSSVVFAKAPMRCVGRQARKLRMSEMKQRLMIAGFHIDLWLCLDAIVDDDIQSVALAHGRDCTMCAVAEQLIDFGFIGHIDVITEFCPQFRQAEVMRCGHDGEHIFAVAPQHDAFTETIARDMACLSRPSGRHAEFVQDLLVLDVFSGQVFLQCGSDGHDVTSGAVGRPSAVRSSCRASPYDGRLRDYKVKIGRRLGRAIPTKNQAASVRHFGYHQTMTIGITGPGRKAPRQNAVVGLIIAAFIVGICLTLLRFATDFLVDWLWFSSIGYLPVFLTSVGAKAAVFLAVLTATAVILWLNGWLAVRI